MDSVVDLHEIVDRLEVMVPDPSAGLPEDLFLFLSRITPLVNVDLLIKDAHNQTLLTWRDDAYYEPGWHIPGGIIRYKESIADRLRAVAQTELGAEVESDLVPLAINEVIHAHRQTRGHFISLLYRCTLITEPDEKLRFDGVQPKRNEWMWHASCPVNLISVHEMYRTYI